MGKKAVICGISGQDGAYLAELLIGKGYEVWGTSRDAAMHKFGNLQTLGIHEAVHVRSMACNDFRSVLQTLTHCEPDEIYNLAGQSSVGLSFEQPIETLDSIQTATMNLLEVIRYLGAPVKLYNAGSGECFGNTGDDAATEETAFKPRSPYAVAKAAAFWMVSNYREAYGIQAGTGILFNHESPLRPERFVTKKIVSAACRIANGSSETLKLGNTKIIRDWGWAPEYVEAMWLMLQEEQVSDYVIATGKSNPLEAFVSAVFGAVGLDAGDLVTCDQSLFRPTDIEIGRADPSKAAMKLGWKAECNLVQVAERMVAAELSRTSE